MCLGNWKRRIPSNYLQPRKNNKWWPIRCSLGKQKIYRMFIQYFNRWSALRKTMGHWVSARLHIARAPALQAANHPTPCNLCNNPSPYFAESFRITLRKGQINHYYPLFKWSLKCSSCSWTTMTPSVKLAGSWSHSQITYILQPTCSLLK
jgi:hypothetical protein